MTKQIQSVPELWQYCFQAVAELSAVTKLSSMLSTTPDSTSPNSSTSDEASQCYDRTQDWYEQFICFIFCLCQENVPWPDYNWMPGRQSSHRRISDWLWLLVCEMHPKYGWCHNITKQTCVYFWWLAMFVCWSCKNHKLPISKNTNINILVRNLMSRWAIRRCLSISGKKVFCIIQV